MNTFSETDIVRVVREPMLGDLWQIRLARRTVDQGVARIACAAPVVYCARTPDMMGMEVPSTFQLDQDGAQQLMDELWRAGIRPTEGEGSAGQLAAVRDHLKDLQRLVFKEKRGAA